MVLIDNKGRLFGKINIVDFLIIALFVIIIPVFFHTYRVMQKTPIRVPWRWVKVEIVTFTIPEIAEMIKSGDLTYDEYGNQDGEVVKVFSKPAMYNNTLKNAIIQKTKTKTIAIKDLIPVYLEVELKCTYDTESKKYYFRRAPLFVSLQHAFTFTAGGYSTTCYVIKIKDGHLGD